MERLRARVEGDADHSNDDDDNNDDEDAHADSLDGAAASLAAAASSHLPRTHTASIVPECAECARASL